MQEFRHIVRIVGTDIDGSQRLAYGLANIKGLGTSLAKVVVMKANLDQSMKIGDLSDLDTQGIETILKNPQKFAIPRWMLNRRKDLETGEDLHFIGPDLSLRTKSDIDNMRKMKSWKGVRHSLELKVRGQRTKTTGRSGRSVGVKKRRRVATV
jgi:small subunit ribosomal protein S13